MRALSPPPWSRVRHPTLPDGGGRETLQSGGVAAPGGPSDIAPKTFVHGGLPNIRNPDPLGEWRRIRFNYRGRRMKAFASRPHGP